MPNTLLQLPGSTKIPDDFEHWLGIEVPLRVDNLLFAHADDLQRKSGIPLSSALAVALASLSAVVGPGLHVHNPVGAPLPACINMLSTDANRGIGRGVELSLRGYWAALDRLLGERMSWSERGRDCQIRAAQAEYDEQCRAVNERAAASADSPTSDPKLAEAFQNRDAAHRRLCELQFTTRPWIHAEALAAHDLGGFIAKSHDRALLLRPRSIGELVAEPNLVHHFLLAGWYGRICEIAPGESCSPVVVNICLGVSPDIAGAGFDSPLGSLLATFFIARSRDEKIRLTGADEIAAWDDFTSNLIRGRLGATPSLWKLSPGALEIFEKFCNDLHDLAAGLSGLQARLVELWPEQLLKIGLLCAVMSPDTGASTISAAVMGQAATVLRMLGRQQLLHHPMLQPATAKLDPEIAGVAAKLQLHGPMTMRGLCRRFHNRRIDELELVLARAAELGLVKVVDGLVQLLANVTTVSVSARQRPLTEISKSHEIAP